MLTSTHAAVTLNYETLGGFPTADTTEAVVAASEARGDASIAVQTDPETAKAIREWCTSRPTLLITPTEKLSENETAVVVTFLRLADFDEFKAWLARRNEFWLAQARTGEAAEGQPMNRRQRRAASRHGYQPPPLGY